MRPGRHKRADRIKGGSFAAVIRAYMMSPKFDALALSTRVSYGYLLRLAERPDTLGALPVDVVRPALVQAFLDGFADRPAQQKCAQTALKSVEKWALVRDLLPFPSLPALKRSAPRAATSLGPRSRSRSPRKHARPHLARVITLAANTGQRGSDLVKMRWSVIEEVGGPAWASTSPRKKTGLADLGAVHPRNSQAAVAPLGAAADLHPPLKEDGLPFTRQQLSDQWLRERDTRPSLAPLKEAGLVLHGLRAFAVVRLRRAGANTGQIADMVGLSEESW